MAKQRLNYKPGDQFFTRTILTWRIIQTAVWRVGTRYFTPFDNHSRYLCNTVINHSARI
jgi:hypothetical protein